MNHPVGIFKADQKPATTWEKFLKQWRADDGRVESLDDALSVMYTNGETFTGYTVWQESDGPVENEFRAILLGTSDDLFAEMATKGFHVKHSASIVDVDYYSADGRNRATYDRQHHRSLGSVARSDHFQGPQYLYSTERGMRLVWQAGRLDLDETVKWSLERGLFVDPTSLDWTREYRLPRDHYGFQRIVRGA